MHTWVPHSVSVDAPQLVIDDADAVWSVTIGYDEGSFDADGRRASAAYHFIEDCSLASINLGGKERSREYLVDLCGETAVEEAEEWVSDTLDARQVIADAADEYAAE